MASALFTISTPRGRLDEFIAACGEVKANRITASAINEALQPYGRKLISDKLKTELGMKVSDIKDLIKRIPAKASTKNGGPVLEGSLVVSRKSVSLRVFKPKQTAEGVSVLIKPGEARQVIKHAFLIKPSHMLKSSNRTGLAGQVMLFSPIYWKRRGVTVTRKKRKPPHWSRLSITKLQGPTAAGVLGNRAELTDDILIKIAAKFGERWLSKFNLIMGGGGANLAAGRRGASTEQTS